jgi:hypothetical protein
MPHPSATVIEKGVVVGMLLLCAVAPPLLVEGFPLSAAPMFAAPCDQLWRYRLTDAGGNVLDNDRFGLRSNVCWYLEPYYGVKYPKNAVGPPMRDPDVAALVDHVRQVGEVSRSRFPLYLEAINFGDIGGTTVGERQHTSWVVECEP